MENKILYRASVGVYQGKAEVTFILHEVLSETSQYYIIRHRGINKKVKKVAAHPFASETKKQALLTLKNHLEGFKFAGWSPQSEPYKNNEYKIALINKELEKYEAN